MSTAFVSANSRHRTLHIDSGRTVYHVKALTSTEFNLWTATIKKFIVNPLVEDGTLGREGNPPNASTSGSSGQFDSEVVSQVNKLAGVSWPSLHASRLLQLLTGC